MKSILFALALGISTSLGPMTVKADPGDITIECFRGVCYKCVELANGQFKCSRIIEE